VQGTNTECNQKRDWFGGFVDKKQGLKVHIVTPGKKYCKYGQFPKSTA